MPAKTFVMRGREIPVGADLLSQFSFVVLRPVALIVWLKDRCLHFATRTYIASTYIAMLLSPGLQAISTYGVMTILAHRIKV